MLWRSKIIFLIVRCTVSHSQANLNDSHNQMVVHWAGEKSDVIVALARDSVGATDPKTSSVSMHIVSFSLSIDCRSPVS